MKISVKTLKGIHFQIQVKPQDTVDDVKKNIEYTHGADTYPAAQQMLIHQGKVLKDGTTLEENKVAENSFVVIMLSKSKESKAEGSTTSNAPTVKAPQTSATPTSIQEFTTPQPPAAVPAPAPAPAPTTAPIPAASDVSFGLPLPAPSLVAANNLEVSIQQILEVSGGNWDRDTVVRALRAAYNNQERAIEYLYSASLPEFDDVFPGIPEAAEAPPASGNVSSGQAANIPAQPQAGQPAPVTSAGPNANPLDLFPQGLPSMGSNAGGANTLDFLRTSPQFQALRAMVQANPQILQPMLQELGKQNPQLVGLIQENQADFLHLINEHIGGEEGINDILGLLSGEMQEAIEVTPGEREALERLEAMGFDRELVLEVFFACNKNEGLAANYLLDHMHEFED